MDRFSGNEEVEFSEREFNQGVEARRNRQPVYSCPYGLGWDRRSWIAGWCDEDQSIISQSET
jgi:ribosome modulation factor